MPTQRSHVRVAHNARKQEKSTPFFPVLRSPPYLCVQYGWFLVVSQHLDVSLLGVSSRLLRILAAEFSNRIRRELRDKKREKKKEQKERSKEKKKNNHTLKTEKEKLKKKKKKRVCNQKNRRFEIHVF